MQALSMAVNSSELVAMAAAAIAEDSGTDVSKVRVLSIHEVIIHSEEDNN